MRRRRGHALRRRYGHAKVNRARGVIRLGRADTKLWEYGGPSGFEFRRKIRGVAQKLAQSTGKAVEIYASESAGGWMADQIMPERD
jgi:hypothetical protein